MKVTDLVTEFAQPVVESFGCELDLPATIARGDDVCKIRFVRREKKD